MSARIAVLISGSGTNLQAIIDSIQRGELDAEIAVVVSNRKAAYGLVRAAQADIATLYFPLKPTINQGLSRADYDAELARRLLPLNLDWIVLAGWMQILTETFLNAFPGRVINLHPALPGAFPGTDAIHRAYDAFQRGEVQSGGCMIHYVVPEIDAGEVITQAAVPIEPDDTPETFEARVHEAEHRLIVEALRRVIQAEGSTAPK